MRILTSLKNYFNLDFLKTYDFSLLKAISVLFWEWTSGEFQCCHQTSNIRCTLDGNEIVDHSDVVGASPFDAAPTQYIFILDLAAGFNGLGKDNCKSRQETLKF